MVDTNKLRGIIAERGTTQNKVAESIGITPKTFYAKMKKRVFGTDEIEKMMSVLNIEDVSIFFGH